jgi:hypothetical protein
MLLSDLINNSLLNGLKTKSCPPKEDCREKQKNPWLQQQ